MGTRCRLPGRRPGWSGRVSVLWRRGRIPGLPVALPWLSLLAAYACASRTAPAGRMRVGFAARCGVDGRGRLSLVRFLRAGAHQPRAVQRCSRRPVVRAARAGRIDAHRSRARRSRPSDRALPRCRLSDPSSLVTYAQFVGHRLGVRDVSQLIGLIKQQRARPAYVVLSAFQEDYARLQGLLPAGSLDGSSPRLSALRGSEPSFTCPRCGSSSTAHSGVAGVDGRGARSHDHPGLLYHSIGDDPPPVRFMGLGIARAVPGPRRADRRQRAHAGDDQRARFDASRASGRSWTGRSRSPSTTATPTPTSGRGAPPAGAVRDRVRHDW